MYIEWKLLELAQDRPCAKCGIVVPKGTPVLFSPLKRTYVCLSHAQSLARPNLHGSEVNEPLQPEELEPKEVLVEREKWSPEKCNTWQTTRMIYNLNECSECGNNIPKGTFGLWLKSESIVACLTHTKLTQELSSEETKEIIPGIPGESARRQYLLIHNEDLAWLKEQKIKIKKAHPIFGPPFVALFSIFPERLLGTFNQDKRGWARGYHGERAIGKRLDKYENKYGIKVLHDRIQQIGVPYNIDHIAITSRGVYVIDSKNYTKKAISIDNGWMTGEKPTRLFLGNDEHTELIHNLKEYQIKRVENILKTNNIIMPVTGVLTFYKGTYHPFFWKPWRVDGIRLTPYGLWPILARRGIYSQEDIRKTTAVLAKAFPMAK